MTKDEVKKLRMNSPESLQFLNNATKFYNLMMMYRCAIREIQTKLEVLDDEFSVENNRNPIYECGMLLVKKLRMILILVNTLFITIIKHSKQVLFSLMQTVLWIMSRSEKKFISV